MQNSNFVFRMIFNPIHIHPKQGVSLPKMKLIHWIYCILISAAHFAYTVAFPSILNGERYLGQGQSILEPSYIHAFFLSRLKFGEFARRPITTWLIQLFESIGLPLDVAFTLVLYIGLTLAFALLFKLALELKQTPRAATLSVILFAGSFWVLHSFFAEIYAYDEPWQYVFLFASLVFLTRRNTLVFSVWFFLALIARESTILLLPSIFLFFIIEEPIFSKRNFIQLLKVGWPVMAYGLFLYFLIENLGLEEKSSSYMRDVRFNHLLYSFEQTDIGIDTLTSFIMSIAMPMTLLFARYKFKNISQLDRPWIYAFLFGFGLNAFITFAFTMGRETRIFAQPVVFILPFLGGYMLTMFKGSNLPFQNAFISRSDFGKWAGIASLVWSTTFALSLFAYELYWPTDTKFFTGFQHYVYLQLALSFLLIVIVTIKGSEEPSGSNRYRYAPFAVLLLPTLLFFGNQNGYRGVSAFEDALIEVGRIDSIETRKHYVVTSTAMPNVAENYFHSSGLPNLAGDFNFQLPVKQFLYRTDQFIDNNIAYIEEQRPVHFPFRYILSGYGRLTPQHFGKHEGLIIHTNQAPEIEDDTYHNNDTWDGFSLKTNVAGEIEKKISGEYSLAFHGSLEELAIDSLTSFAARVDFKANMSSKAAIVVTIGSNDENQYWEHEFLNLYLIHPSGWNTAYKARKFPAISDPSTEVSFYVWNPEKDELVLRNLEITLNSGLVLD
jgi:hypothetical protein